MVIWIVSGIIAVPFLIWGMHRFACALEQAGYIRYRDRDEESGGGGATAGVMGEIDKITRPHAEHVVTEAKEERRIVIKK